MRWALFVTALSSSLSVGCAVSDDVDESGAGGAQAGGAGGTLSGGGGGGFGGVGASVGGGGTSGSGASGGAGGTLPSGGGVGGTPSGGGAGGTPSGGGTGGSATGGGGVTGGGGGASCAVVGCADGSESGAGCSNARVVGRVSAAKLGGVDLTANTCSAGNDVSGYDATTCKDQGRDRSWRMYLKKNELLDVKLTQGAKCASAPSWNRIFKIYSGSSCTDQGCGKKQLCANPGSGTWVTKFVPQEDGWYVLVVDGQGADDAGDFTLNLSLLCTFGGCEC